jgi:arsenate reductase-like glutaredoxin family protein
MEIKVLGTGCASCKALFSTTEQAVKELNLDAQVVKEEDMLKIMEYKRIVTSGFGGRWQSGCQRQKVICR